MSYSSVASSSSSSSSTSSPCILTDEDKKHIKGMYQKLDSSKMWTLSTGTVVEKQMEKLATKCNAEHPCHSLILDADDENWLDYFTESELKEIRDHKSNELIPLSSELKEYLDSLVQKDDANEMHRDIFKIYYDPIVNPACYWAQMTLINGLDLHRSGFFNALSEHSERDFLTQVWSMTLNAFNCSKIDILMVINSKACLAEIDESRRLGSTSPLSKMRHSKRLDHLYSYHENELGFLNSANKSDGNGNEEYEDALLKAPKIMKDLFLQLKKQNLGLISSIKVPCLITNALDIKLLVLDAPEGYVCRVSSSQKIKYPASFDTFITDIVPCLELTWRTKSIMETTVKALKDRERLPISFKRKRGTEIPSCFVRPSKKPAPNVTMDVDSPTS